MGPLFDHTLPDGRVMKQHVKREKIDRVEQLLLAKRRYWLYENEQLVAEEVFDSNERWYFKQEMVLMQEKGWVRLVLMRLIEDHLGYSSTCRELMAACSG